MSGRRFALKLPVHFGDVDYARILYYPRLLHYCHVSMEAFFSEITGRSYAHLLAERKLGFPTVHLDVTYRKPIPYGSTLNMKVSVVRIGTSSVDLRYTETGEAGSGSRAEVVGTVVCADMERFKSVPIHDDIRKGLEEHMEP